jgi:hypothetical protein
MRSQEHGRHRSGFDGAALSLFRAHAVKNFGNDLVHYRLIACTVLNGPKLAFLGHLVSPDRVV